MKKRKRKDVFFFSKMTDEKKVCITMIEVVDDPRRTLILIIIIIIIIIIEVRLRATFVIEVQGVIDVFTTPAGLPNLYPDGHPSRYQPCPTELNFGEQMGTGVFPVVNILYQSMLSLLLYNINSTSC